MLVINISIFIFHYIIVKIITRKYKDGKNMNKIEFIEVLIYEFLQFRRIES